MPMSEEAKKSRRQYMKQYRDKNKEHINKRQRERYQEDPEKHKRYQSSYWERRGNELPKNSEES